MFKGSIDSRVRAFVGGLALAVVLGTGTIARAMPSDLFTVVPRSAAMDQNQRVVMLRARPTTQSLQIVNINIEALKGARVTLPLAANRSLSLLRQSIEPTTGQDFIWHGTLADVPGTATLVVRNGAVTGTVQNGADLYRIEPLGAGLHALIKVDTSKFPPEEPPSMRSLERDNHRDAPPPGPDANALDGPVGIDVEVGYTAAAKAAVSDIVATIQLAVAEANQAYVNSAINIKLNLVDTFAVNEVETGKTFDTILADFVANTDVAAHHTSSGADLSALIIDQSDYCGLADAIGASPSTAYVIVHYSCATGYYSFAHELGHLMSARHDPAHDSTSTPYAYGHGYQQTGSAPSWRTIMAYDCPSSCPRLQYFSNPNITHNSLAMGTASGNDNHRVLNQTATAVAAFNSPPPPPASDVGSVWRSTGAPCSGTACPGWVRLDDNARTVRIASGGGALYQLHNDGAIWKSTGAACSGASCPGWQQLDNNGATVAIVAAGNDLYQLHSTGRIWRYTGTPCNGATCPGWQMIDDNPAAVAIVAATGGLYQLHNNGKIWRFTGTPCTGNSCPGWQQLDNNGATVAITAGGNDLYQLHDTGKIWRYTGTPCNGTTCPGWQMIDDNPAALAITATAGGLYQLHNTGRIWHYNGTPCAGASCPGWVMLDDNAATLDIVADGASLYQLHNTGRIWRYTGTPCSGTSCPGWTMLDDNGATGAISAAGGQLYQIHVGRRARSRTRVCYDCR